MHAFFILLLFLHLILFLPVIDLLLSVIVLFFSSF